MRTHILLTATPDGVKKFPTLYPIASTAFYTSDAGKTYAKIIGTEGAEEQILEPFAKIVAALNPIQVHTGPKES